MAQADDDDEATLLMVTFCALHDVEAKEKGEVMAVEEHGKALKAVNIDEPRAQGHLERVGNHMTVVPGLRRQQPHDGLQGSLLRARRQRDWHGEVW